MPWGSDPVVHPAPVSPQTKTRELSNAATETNIQQGRAALARAPFDTAKAAVELEKAKRELKNEPVGPKLTAEQSKARTYYTAMSLGEKAYEQAITDKYDPNKAANIAASAIEAIFPNAQIGISLSNAFRDSLSQRGRNAERRFEEGYKRALSGAAVGEKIEAPQMRAQLFPGPFSSGDPKNLEEMKAYRLSQILAQQQAGAISPGDNMASAPAAAPSRSPPAEAVAKLKANPQLRAHYDAKYGSGASDSVLGRPR